MNAQVDIFADPRENENGVICEEAEEIHTMAGPARRKSEWWGWAIRAAQLPDGTWRAAPSYASGTCGFTWPLSASLDAHATRQEAVEAAARHILAFLGRGPLDAQGKASAKELTALLTLPERMKETA